MKYGEEKPRKKTGRRFYTHMSSGRKPREEKDIFKRPSLRQFQITGDILASLLTIWHKKQLLIGSKFSYGNQVVGRKKQGFLEKKYETNFD